MDLSAISAAINSVCSAWLKTDSNKLGLTTLLYFGFFAIMVAIYYRRAVMTTDPLPKLRRIPGLDAIDEAIGRATEMGRPVTYNTGASAISAPTLAAMAILGYVAKQTARYDTRIIVPLRFPEVLPLAQSTIQMAHIEVGKPDTYRADDIRYISNDQFGFTSGCIGIIKREKVAAQLMFGAFMSEALILAEEGNIAGAIQIAGQTVTAQTPFLIAACDYTLMVEELYVASAYLAKDRVRTGMLAAQDISKIVLIVLILLGIVFNTFGSTFIQDIMSLY